MVERRVPSLAMPDQFHHGRFGRERMRSVETFRAGKTLLLIFDQNKGSILVAIRKTTGTARHHHNPWEDSK